MKPYLLACGLWSMLLLTTAHTHAQFQYNNQKIGEADYLLSVAHTDWNNDGLPDAMTGGYAHAKLTLHIQNKAGKFTSFVLPQETQEVQRILTGDFDQDKNPDILTLGNPVMCLLGDGKNGIKKQIKIVEEYCTEAGLIDFDDDGVEDIVLAGKEGLLFFQNKGQGNFEKVPAKFNALEVNSLKIADIDQDGKPDIITSGKEVSVYWNKGKGNFEQETVIKKENEGKDWVCIGVEKMSKEGGYCLILFKYLASNDTKYLFLEHTKNASKGSFRTKAQGQRAGRQLHTLFQDVNGDGIQDMSIISDSKIEVLVNPTEPYTNKNTQVVADLQGYVKAIAPLKSTQEAGKVQFFYVGAGKSYKEYGLYTLYIPTITFGKNQQDILEAISDKKASQNIKTYLEKKYRIQNGTDLLLFTYTKTKETQASYVVRLEDNYFTFDGAGKFLTSSLPEINQQTPYSPIDEKTDFQPQTATGIAKEFLAKYYPNHTYKWYVDKNASGYFQYKGERIDEGKEPETLYFSFQNYSDGLEWHFWTSRLIRNYNADNAFSIIKDEKIAQKIRYYISSRYVIAEPYRPDVFEYEYAHFVTPQSSENISFPADMKAEKYYGVYIQNKCYFFSMKGDFVKIE